MNDLNVKINSESLTPGQMLNQARTARNLTEADVAQQLLLSKHIIVALENDDYRKIVAPVYAKGYLRSYANFLGLPVEQVLQGFKQLNAYSDEEVFHDSVAKTTSEASVALIRKLPLRGLAYLTFGVVVIILVALIAIHSTSGKKSDEEAIGNDTAVNLDVPVKTETPVKSKVVLPKVEKAVESTPKASAPEAPEAGSQEIALPGQENKSS